MKPIAPGTVIFHRHRGFGVLTAVNLMTGWVSARFGAEQRCLDLNLSTDQLQHADGEAIRFRLQPPERMPHARLMAMVRALHSAGYQRLYLYSFPVASGLHWRWHLFAGPRQWLQRPLRHGWYGNGADYIFNPVMGWGDAPGAGTEELIEALARFDPEGLALALGRDEDYAAWFAQVCEQLLPDYAFSLGSGDATLPFPAYLPTMPVRARQPDCVHRLTYPPGWKESWPARDLSTHLQQAATVRHDIAGHGWNLPMEW
ncbi:L-asparaginase [Undibacterium luofuense]|uniref:L-asparaginase n=1 Tax=Undibacterium luofuense TaxID=2828733 RepID=UPI0030EEE9ED